MTELALRQLTGDELRDEQIIQDVVKGCDVGQVAYVYGVTLEYIQGLFQPPRFLGNNQATKALELARLDVATRALMPRVEVGDLDAIAALIKVQSRRSRYLGLDTPAQFNVSGQLDHIHQWPEWLTSRRLAYQESAQYAEDIVPRELQGRPQADPAPEVVDSAPRASPFTPPPPMKFNLGDKAYIAPVYTGYAKSKPLQTNLVPPRNEEPTWTLPEPDPYDETPPLLRAMQTPEQAEEHAWEQAQQAQERIGELERALERERTPELEQAYRQAVQEGMSCQRVYMRAQEKAREEAERKAAEPRRVKAPGTGQNRSESGRFRK